MSTLNEAIVVAYRSAAVAYASCSTRKDIALRKRLRARRRMAEVEGKPQYVRAEARHVLWWNYWTAQDFALKFCMKPKIGARGRLRRLWVQLGNDPADLPNWNRIIDRRIKTVVSFRNFNNMTVKNVRDREDTFTDNTDEIPTTGFNAEFEEMLDLFTNDLWAAEGMRLWNASVLTRAGEPLAALTEWDDILLGTGQFFNNATRCCAKLGMNFSLYETDVSNEDDFVRKYKHRAANRYKAVNGLFAIKPADLPASYQNRVESKRVRYR